MANEEARALRQEGIAAAKAGRKDEARALLQQAIRLEPGSEAAWMWLASVARDQRERVFALQKLLEINPDNTTAQQALDSLMAADIPAASSPTVAPIKPLSAAPAAPAAPEEPAAPVQPFALEPVQDARATNVPLPSAEAVSAAHKRADALIHTMLAASETPPVQWTHKTKGRAGERDIVVLRLQIAAAIGAALFVLAIAGGVLVTTNDTLRAAVFAPTATLTLTPTATFTPTPGLTPTPSAAPRRASTETPVPPLIMEGANPYALPQATEIYPVVLDRPMQEAIAALDRGEFDVALPTLSAERRLTENEFKAEPYYYEARALIAQGELADARALLEEAEERLPDRSTNTDRALVNSGFAQLAWAEAAQALAVNQRGRARTSLEEAADRATQALELDERLAEPYLVLARTQRQNRDYDAALETLSKGLDNERLLPSNVDLLMEKGRVYFDQREYDLADAQAALALYVDPRTAAAHELRIAASLAEDQPGRAALQAQDYLYYLPGSARAWQLLGDARRAEGNPDLALAAYSQALAGNDRSAELDSLLARASLYSSRGRWDAAREDLTSALSISDRSDIRALRLVAAYNAGRFAVAADDAEALAGTDALPQPELDLLTARILIDGADGESATPFRQALNLLAPLAGGESGLEETLRPVLNEYLARAHLGSGDADTALGFIDLALADGETPARHLVRGLIFEAQDEPEAARQEFDWVLTWADIAPLAAAEQAAGRLDALAG